MSLVYRRCLAVFVCCLLVLLTGCYQSVSTRLQGKWQGKPDSPAAQAERERTRLDSEAKADPTAARSPQAIVAAEGVKETPDVTDIQALDFAIKLHFAPRGHLTMQLDETRPLDATWQIIDTLPLGALIEVTQHAEKESDQIKRRFEIEFEGDEPAGGFRLRESGADRRFGQLFFTPDNG